MVGRNLTDEERQQVAHFLLQHISNGKLKHEQRLRAANQWACSVRTISTIWARVKQQIAGGESISARSLRHGRPCPTRKPIDTAALMAIPLSKRRTCRSTAAALQMSKSTVHRAVTNKEIRSHTNAVHPFLSTTAKLRRMEWCLSSVECNMQFKDMHNIIHIDEKWFYLTESTTRYLLAPEEPEPYRTQHNKHYIPKLMFLCAVCRPIFDHEGNCVFDGKVGVFPYTEYVAAKKNSVNRPRGTLVLTPIKKVNRECTRKKLIYDVIPAIKAKWPAWLSKQISIQQDNAPSHILSNDPEFTAAANSDGFTIKMVCQPARSPDLNILDLGFFASIQSLQHETPSTDLEGLLEAVNNAFEREDPKKINHIFLSLQNVMIEIMKDKGGNNFKLPHMGKQRLMRQGILPTNLIVEHEIVRKCLEDLIAVGMTAQVQDLMLSLEMG